MYREKRPGPRVAGRRAQGGLVLGGLDEALPRLEFTAWPGWPSPGARAGPWASNTARLRCLCYYAWTLVRAFSIYR